MQLKGPLRGRIRRTAASLETRTRWEKQQGIKKAGRKLGVSAAEPSSHSWCWGSVFRFPYCCTSLSRTTSRARRGCALSARRATPSTSSNNGSALIRTLSTGLEHCSALPDLFLEPSSITTLLGWTWNAGIPAFRTSTTRNTFRQGKNGNLKHALGTTPVSTHAVIRASLL